MDLVSQIQLTSALKDNKQICFNPQNIKGKGAGSMGKNQQVLLLHVMNIQIHSIDMHIHKEAFLRFYCLDLYYLIQFGCIE